MKKMPKSYYIIIVALMALMLFTINFYGIGVKVSKDYQFVEVALPTDVLSLDEFRTVDVWVIELSDMANRQQLSTQLRRDFRTCYWGNGNDLWLDGDTGIVLYQYENSEWKEYPVTGMDNEKITCLSLDAPKVIDIKSVPEKIVKRINRNH